MDLILSLFVPLAGPLPPTVPWTIDGQVVGTATMNGRHIYYRNKQHQLIVQSEIFPDGKVTFYDISGKQLDSMPRP